MNRSAKQVHSLQNAYHGFAILIRLISLLAVSGRASERFKLSEQMAVTAIYEKEGVSFQYPENWSLDEVLNEDSTDVTIHSPAGAVWSIAIFPKSCDPSHVAAESLKAMQAEYPDLESEAVEETLADLALIGFDIDFICLDLIVTGTLRAFRLGDHTICVTAQAESRDYDALAEVFRAMTFSLIQNQNSQKRRSR